MLKDIFTPEDQAVYVKHASFCFFDRTSCGKSTLNLRSDCTTSIFCRGLMALTLFSFSNPHLLLPLKRCASPITDGVFVLPVVWRRVKRESRCSHPLKEVSIKIPLNVAIHLTLFKNVPCRNEIIFIVPKGISSERHCCVSLCAHLLLDVEQSAGAG